jgi:cytochrome o ubiquinol oxidase operon protein cyoD
MKNYKSLLKSYITGFILSVVLTLFAYYLVVNANYFSHEVITVIILALAFAQLVVQLLFFLHMGKESKPRWNLIIFLSFASVIFIMVAGSLWIMNHLNYNMSPAQMGNFIIHDEGIRK